MTRLIRLAVFFFASLVSISWAQDSGLSDPNWVSGELENGLRYFIRPNGKPENRLEIRLVVNAGSILEADDQQGLAHFLEHSAFNGTRNFEKQEMVDYLESLGMVFGPDLNAYTSFDETVYKLRVPTENQETVEKAFLILSDWAGEITNSDEALDGERGVVIEEWRGSRGADARLRDLQFPVMFAGSQYAVRLPIGTLEVLENFDFDRLRDFYRDWYRPDLISVVAVGDLDVEKTRELIEKYFSELKGPENPPERVDYLHPEHKKTLVGVFTDPELTSSEITLMWKRLPNPVRNEADYIEDLKSFLAADMLTQRLTELTQQPDAPFLQGGSYQGGYTRGGDVFLLYGAVKDQEGAHLKAAKTLLTEAWRVKQHGFTQAELDRALSRIIRSLEKSFAERNNTESDTLANEIIRHALTGEYVPGIERELEVNQKVLADINLEELQSLVVTWMTDDNRVIMASGPSRDEGNLLPSEEELLSVFSNTESLDLVAYDDGLSDLPLIQSQPEPGKLTKRSDREDLGLTMLEFSNNLRIILKPTDFKHDEILLQGWRSGGMNLASEDQWLSARMAASVAETNGMGSFSAVDLQKKLSGKLAGLSVSLSMDQDELQGSASPQDLETLFKLIHLRFTTVREDPSAFAALQERLREGVRNRLSDPQAEFDEMVNLTLSDFHPRMQPLSLEDVDQISMQDSLRFFSSRFGNASGFTFLFTGNIDPETFIPLAEKWLASLPSEPPQSEARFLDTDFPKYELRRIMRKGLEPISQVQMVWTTDDFNWTYASRHRMQSMISALRIRLREELREEQGGTYHVSAWTPQRHYPEPRAMVRIAFSCDPEKVEGLIESVYGLIEEIQESPLDPSYAQKVREGQLRRREVDLKENSFWSFVIPFYDWHGEDLGVLFDFETYVESTTPESLQETAASFFETPHHSVFILYPEHRLTETVDETP